MGWYGNYTVDEMMAEAKSDFGPRLREMQYFGSDRNGELWMAVEMPETSEHAGKVILVLYLFESRAMDGSGMYKPMDETEFPYYYRVPKRWLDKYQDFANVGASPRWRAKMGWHPPTERADPQTAFAF